jgi:sulfur-oxidizing protein SoxY
MLTRRAAVLLSVSLLARPARATSDARNEALRRFTGGTEPRPGRVTLDMPPLVENGNAAALSVSVDSPMTPDDHVRRIAVFNEANPQPEVFVARFGPAAARAALDTRIRLANSQTITAVAELSDGTFWSATADVIVTLAACVEGSG